MARTRRPTCGSSTSITPTAARVSASLFRDRAGEDVHTIIGSVAADARTSQCAQRNCGVAVARELGIRRRPHPQGAGDFRRRQATLHAHRRVERRDGDRRLRPSSGRDRGGAARRRASRPKASVIAVVQPHRYTRLQSLFEQFCTCFNDADAVIVAQVYPAGEPPIARHRPRRARRRHARARSSSGGAARRTGATRRRS